MAVLVLPFWRMALVGCGRRLCVVRVDGGARARRMATWKGGGRAR
jgi:hypothetical protein